MKLIGTQNILVARIVCARLALVGLLPLAAIIHAASAGPGYRPRRERHTEPACYGPPSLPHSSTAPLPKRPPALASLDSVRLIGLSAENVVVMMGVLNTGLNVPGSYRICEPTERVG
jgi:hypothetical protein